MREWATLSEVEAVSGVSRGRLAQACRDAVARGEDWATMKSQQHGWRVRPHELLRAVRAAKRGGMEARRAATALADLEAPADAGATRADATTPNGDAGATPATSGEPEAEIDILNRQIRVSLKMLERFERAEADGRTQFEIDRLFKDTSGELRQLLKRRREVEELDAAVIAREDADQRLVLLAQAVRHELDNLPKQVPAKLVQAMSDHGETFEDVDRTTRVVGVKLEEESARILTMVADRIAEESKP